MSFQNVFNNTVIQETASKSHNIYVLSLYDVNRNIFSKEGLSYGSSVNGPKSGRFYPAYMWDLYTLGQQIGGELSKDANREGHYPTSSTSMPWKTLFCENYSDDSGSSIYAPLKNFTPLTINNHPIFSNQKYSGNFGFSPLININVNTDIQNIINTYVKSISNYLNDQAGAELSIFYACKIPLFPLMFCSSLNSHYSYGPVFLSNITFSVGGDSNISNVQIDCQFTGGKSLISPEINLLKKQKPGIEPIVYNSMEDFNGNAIEENASDFLNTGLAIDYHRYRSANFLDCLVYKQFIPIFEVMLALSKIPQITIPSEKIIGVTMQISQEIQFDYTNPKIYENDTLKNMNDKFGPRFAYLTDRTVTGSIKYFGFTKTEKVQKTTGLTLYFGGPFFFPMKNVEWSNPTISISPGGGYIFTYNFTARLARGTQTKFPFNNDVLKTDVSEFTYDPLSVDLQDFLDNNAKDILNNIIGRL